MASIAVALLTEIETPLISTAAALDNNRPVQLTATVARRASAVERVSLGAQATERLAQELEA
jgi:tRNA A37 threonylcarbamoyladenosine synthetase subunit TsaC/SUA5/YrdC